MVAVGEGPGIVTSIALVAAMGTGSIPGPGTSACHGAAKKKPHLYIIFFSFWPHPHHMEVTGPGIKCAPQQWKPL